MAVQRQKTSPYACCLNVISVLLIDKVLIRTKNSFFSDDLLVDLIKYLQTILTIANYYYRVSFPSAPVDCIVSNWGAFSTADDSGVQVSIRTILRVPRNGGKQCPDLVRRRKGTNKNLLIRL